jgi:hypothetical protein
LLILEPFKEITNIEMSSIKTFSVSHRGTHTGRHPQWDDCYIKVRREAREKMVSVIAERPKTGYVNYHGHTKTVEGGTLAYEFNEADNEEKVVYENPDSHTDSHGWRGTVTVRLTTTFVVSTL